jgi:aryl-alcohol dehydrogenase-like predicted oxidoreductase
VPSAVTCVQKAFTSALPVAARFRSASIRGLGFGSCHGLEPRWSPTALRGRFRTIDELAPKDWRRGNPRFQGEQFQRNLAIADTIGETVREKGVTSAQLALGWVLAQGEDIIPIPGTSNAQRLEENVRSGEVALTTDELDRLEQAAPKGAAVRGPV